MRYVIFPGPVISKNDGQRHWITSRELARLYKVHYSKCIVVHEGLAEGYKAQKGDIELRPRYDGDYSLPLPWESE